ncbi:hypothetical protein DPMN_067411 [Dreissena polymorpha]|uniref:Uncharacterized protein n=1 Tax=Dreissena polymorpha TaxID=45954 RepID=A0A9D4BVT3_DREPO|nr:hypothetical protein DPMN_067411 [Dreissena polymorpha]
MKSLEKCFNTILAEINALRKTINDTLDQLEKNTKKELNTLLANMKTSIETDINNCTKSIKNIKCVQEDWLTTKDKSEAVDLMTYRKCIVQSLKTKAVLRKMTTNTGNEKTLTFIADTTIQQTLSTLSGLGQIVNKVKQSQDAKNTTKNTATVQGKLKSCNTVSVQLDQTSDLTKPTIIYDPNQVIRVTSSKRYSVRIKNDSVIRYFYIYGICETATGELLITDQDDMKVKLLDQTYKVVAHCGLPCKSVTICSIDSSPVAVALNNID